MSKLRKKLIAVLAVVFCALLCLSMALITPKTKTADAYSGSYRPSTTVSELYSGTNGFSAKNLRMLYGKLVQNAKNYDDVKNALPGSTSTKSVTDFASQDIIVEFGGKQWIAVYISKAQHYLGNVVPDTSRAGYADSDDIVLTLWLAYPTQSNQWQNVGDAILADDIVYVNNGVSYGGKFPANMYSTSYMRSVVLNNGGKYWQNKNTLQDNTQGKQSGNTFSRFTMTQVEGVADSVANYLVAPRYISWQYQQSSKDCGTSNGTPNDAWGKMNNNAYLYDYENFQTYKGWDIDYYPLWKDDLVWLPSGAEIGLGDSGSNLPDGMWHTTLEQRKNQTATWLRSQSPVDTTQAPVDAVDAGHTKCVFTMGSNGTAVQSDRIPVNQSRLVRPAIHLNLTKADEDSRKVCYDDEAGKDGHTYEHEYDGKNYEVDILDSDMLVLDTNTVDNPTAPATYSDGKFSATEPKAKDEMIYSLVIKPDKDKGFYWADWESRSGSDDVKKYGERTYKIKITLAKIKTNEKWKAPSCSVGGSLLLGNDVFTLQGGKTPTIVYYMEYDENKYPAADENAKNWADGEWNSDVTKFKADKAGYYRVYYKVSADFHETAIFSYVVSVGADDIHISVKSGSSIPDTTYSNDKDTDFLKWLKDRLAEVVDIKGSTLTYVPADYLADKVLILRDSDGNEVSAQSNGYYPAGTYTVDFKNSPAWDTDLPAVTINKKKIVVKVVADSVDGFKHAYGDPHAKMKVVLNDDSTTLPDGGKVGDLAFGDYILKKDNGDTVVLDETTPVCEGVVEADTSKITNYEVKFETSDSEYEVTKRKVNLQVADEEAPYGTDFTNYKYKSLKFKNGESLANDELLSEVVISTTYSLKKNGVDTNFSTTLPIGEYELYAKVEADNYEFTVDFGKLKITQAEFDMKDVTFTNTSYLYDGNRHEAQISGTLPSTEITVSYRYVNIADGSESTDPPTEVGLYLVYASFTHSNGNYKDINDKVAYLRIVASADDLNQDYPPLPSDEDIANAAELAKKKQEAKKKLDEEAQAKKDAIDSNKDMTAEDKKAAKDEIEKERQKGNSAIDSAKDASGVEQAFNDGKSEMEDTVELAETKTDAKKELGEEAQAKKDKIDSDKNLTDEEKEAAKAEIDKELEKGKKDIDKAKNVDDVESAENASEKKMEDYTELVQKKGKAKSELDKAAKDKNDAIDASEMTAEEKAEAKKKVEEELADGKANIDGATDKSGIDSAESTAAAKIKNISTEPKSNSSFPWWIIAVGAGALLLIAVIIIIVKRRQVADGEDEYDDFYDDEYDFDEEEDEEGDFGDDY